MKKRNAINESLKKHRKYCTPNKSPEAVALEHIKNNEKHVKKYVESYGVIPAENTILLASQAAIIHEKNIFQNQQQYPDYEIAENNFFSKEITDEKLEVENFIGGDLLGSIFRGGVAGIDAINEKRVKKGKRKILGGKAYENLKNKVRNGDLRIDKNGYQLNGKFNEQKQKSYEEKTEYEVGQEAIINSIKNDATKDYLQKYFPIFVIGIVLFLLFKNK